MSDFFDEILDFRGSTPSGRIILTSADYFENFRLNAKQDEIPSRVDEMSSVGINEKLRVV